MSVLPHCFRYWIKQHWTSLALLCLLPGSFFLRIYGIDWDRGFFFHPDERQILMVVASLSWPQKFFTLFTPNSSLNPHFFAYGSFPIYLLRVLSWLLAVWHAEWASMTRFYLLGRCLAAFFDTLTVFFTYLLARKIYNWQAAILAATFVVFTVLHIQQAHFYTVDTLLTLLIILAVCKAVDVAQGGKIRDGLALGAIVGTALATKVSALPLLGVTVIAWLVFVWPQERSGRVWHQLRSAWHSAKRQIFWSLGVAIGNFVLLQPYAVIDASHFLLGVGQELAMARGWFEFPYTRQYIGTTPYLYHARQILLFAMGFPLGCLGLAGLLWLVVRQWQHFSPDEAVVLAWPLIYGVVNGGAHAKFLRYTLPMLPFLSLAGAAMWVKTWDALENMRRGRKLGFWSLPMKWAWGLLICVVLLTAIFYTMAFLNVYRQPHPWLQATAWLCQHAPEGSTILTEYWDDPLPVQGEAQRGGCPKAYVFLTLDMYAIDTDAGLDSLLDAIENSDYIVLSSQRLYAPILRLSERYPVASRYYQRLFAEQLGFRLVAAPAVYPQWLGITLADDPRAKLSLSLPPLLATAYPRGLVFNLGLADESFTVYDHPQPLIFTKTSYLSRQELRALLTAKGCSAS